MSENRISTALAALRAALICLVALAFVVTGAPNSAQASGSAAIHGVVALPNGIPAANAQVCLFAEPSGGLSSECAAADASGSFGFEGLEPGSYSLSASASGYVTTYSGGSPYLKDRVSVAVAAGQTTQQQLRLRTGAMITGRVVDSSGRPFRYDLAMSLRGPAEDLRPGAELQPSVATDGRKPYRFGPVPDGTYRVVAESMITCTPQQVEACQWAETTVVVSGGRTVTARPLRLTGGTGFTGTVSFPAAVGADQPPTRLFQLEVYNRSGRVVRSGVFEASTARGTRLVGSYALHLEPGRYQLRFTPLDGTASYCLGCAGGLVTTTGKLRNLGTITLAGPVRVLSTGGVRVEGSPAVGQRLTAVTTGWLAGARLHYQWYRNGHRIRGANQSTRLLTARDLRQRMSVRVRATLEAGRSAQVRATLSTRVARGRLTAGTAVVSGIGSIGQRVTASSAGWQPSGVRLHYRWLRDGRAIHGATGRSYRIHRRDLGHGLSVRITATKAGYRTVFANSAVLAIG
jgi:hypothetical protein